MKTCCLWQICEQVSRWWCFLSFGCELLQSDLLVSVFQIARDGFQSLQKVHGLILLKSNQVIEDRRGDLVEDAGQGRKRCTGFNESLDLLLRKIVLLRGSDLFLKLLVYYVYLRREYLVLWKRVFIVPL